MIRLRTPSILKLLGVAVLLAFAMQIAVTQAEHFGFFDCHLKSSSAAASDDVAKDSPSEGCHTACCGHITGISSGHSQFLSLLHHGQMVFVLLDELAPDGPVKAIDHPPQLS